MSDVESREQLQHLARDRALRGHTYRDLQAVGLRVTGGDFTGASFERCTLDEATLETVDFSRTTLKRVTLRRAQLAEATLVRTSAVDCDLTELGLGGAIIEHLEWERVQAANLDLGRAKLSDARFSGCNLYGLRASQAVLVKCRFSDPTPNGAAELTRARFDGAVLIDCDLRGANLFRADFSGALVVRCHFGGATLTGANVDGARFVDCELGGADLPDGLRAPTREA
jgi:2-iminobutanoate/2-iminopropanoate deaminase